MILSARELKCKGRQQRVSNLRLERWLRKGKNSVMCGPREFTPFCIRGPIPVMIYQIGTLNSEYPPSKIRDLQAPPMLEQIEKWTLPPSLCYDCLSWTNLIMIMSDHLCITTQVKYFLTITTSWNFSPFNPNDEEGSRGWVASAKDVERAICWTLAAYLPYVRFTHPFDHNWINSRPCKAIVLVRHRFVGSSQRS